MVAEIKLLEGRNDKMYWFNVPKSLETGFESGRLTYVLVDTVEGLQIGRIVGYSQIPVGFEPTKSVVCFISSSAVEDFYNNRKKKELENTIINKVSAVFSLLLPKNNKFEIMTEDKISMLDYIAKVRGNDTFREKVDEINKLGEELEDLGTDWRF